MAQKDSLALAIVQTDLFWEDAPANQASLEEQLAGLSHPVDVIVLPEMFTTGFSMTPEKVAEPVNLSSTRWMQQIASQFDALVIGSFAAREDNKYYNRLLAVKPDGSFESYDKRHLFRMGGEHQVYNGGKSRLIVDFRGWKICPLICYDLRFPVWSRNSDETPYDLLIYVANWPAARAYAWDTLLRARAIENQAYVAGANRIGSDANGVAHAGGSLLLDFLGKPLSEAGEHATVLTGKVTLSELRKYRERFPAYLDADRFEIEI